jgi:hypothetical protein
LLAQRHCEKKRSASGEIWKLLTDIMANLYVLIVKKNLKRGGDNAGPMDEWIEAVR